MKFKCELSTAEFGDLIVLVEAEYYPPEPGIIAGYAPQSIYANFGEMVDVTNILTADAIREIEYQINQ